MPKHRDMMADAMQLHKEFPIETAFLIDYMQAVIYAIKSNFNYNRQRWDRSKQIFDFSIWADAIDAIDDRLKNNKTVLKKDPGTFARLLFYDGHRIFTLHCLFALADAIPENEKFNNSIIRLFS